ncbi:MAG: hypothetical protein ACT4O0_18820 [Pseudonocardia sp.]|jgi:GNAT superfamily N-acetyltransferase
MTSEAMLGLPAYVVQELVLVPEHRGRGYGSLLTTLVARALPDERPVLLGTIHAENRGALRAAAAAGRIDVGGWLRFRSTELPGTGTILAPTPLGRTAS